MTSRRKQVAPCKVREFAASSECELIENGRGYPMKATDWKNSIIGAEQPDESRPRFSARIRARDEIEERHPSTEAIAQHHHEKSDSMGHTQQDEELTCTICFKSFLSKYGLLTHSETHNSLFKCTLCNQQFEDTDGLLGHQCVAVKCGESGNSLPSKPHAITGFNMPSIDFSCNSFTTIAQSFPAKENQLVKQDMKHLSFCKLCNNFYPTRACLQLHISTQHCPNEKKSPLEGQLSFMAAFRLQANKDQVDTSNQTKVEFGKDLDLYRTSPMVAYTTVPLWLQSTQQDLWEYSGAENGISVKESSNKSEPTTCSIGVHTTSNNRKMYWCRLCNYASFEKSTIMRHQRTHTGLRPYSCTVCKLAFTTKANCERHVRKRHDIKHNTDIKELVFCDHDLLRKARIGNLSNGDEVLKVIPPSSGKYLSFQCRLCKSAFSSRSNGARHVMTKHGIINRKGANEVIMCVKVNKSPQQPETHGVKPINRCPVKTFNPKPTITQSIFNSADKVKHSRPIRKVSLIPLSKVYSYNKAASSLLDRLDDQYRILCGRQPGLSPARGVGGGLLPRINQALQVIADVCENYKCCRRCHNVCDTQGQVDSTHTTSYHGMHETDGWGDLNNDQMDVDLLPSSGQPVEYTGKLHGEEFGNGWEGGDFATVEQLVGFIQNPTVRPMEDNFEEESSSPHKNQVRLSNLHSKTSSGSSFSLKLIPNDPVSSLDSEMEELKGGKGIYEDTLPTMVPQHGQAQGKQHFTGEVRKTVLTSKTSRKCPKCNKIFPWASSLRRHIMTHTGLKPFMCGQCAMQFTTRSNLLRHVHRRHGMEPTANNDDYIITLTPSQQKVLAEEFRKEDKVEDVIIKQEPEEKVVEEPIVSAESPSTPETPVADKTPVIPIVDPRSDPPPLNKRYACGLCGVPFANRSNLVRHLQRLHETTKDHPNFKEMLLKLGTSRQSESEFDSSVNEQNGKSSDTKVLKLSSPNSGETKEFQCAICMIGFTKRNNAARHLQQQHSVSKHGANYCELIIHSKPPPPSDDTHLKTANHENNVNNEVKLEDSQPTQPTTGTTNKTSASKKQAIKEEAVVENEVPKWKGRKRSASRKRLEGEESGEFTILMSSPAKRKEGNHRRKHD